MEILNKGLQHGIELNMIYSILMRNLICRWTTPANSPKPQPCLHNTRFPFCFCLPAPEGRPGDCAPWLSGDQDTIRATKQNSKAHFHVV
jgi:hypothetical protein